jgi:glycosyltransferase involved in cell wall biosynthesis
MAIIINHVTSNNVHSGIFEDIFAYFSKYTEGYAEQIVSEKPVIGAHVRHYHRPHLEKELIRPCIVTVHHDLNDPDGWLSIDAFLDRYREANVVICLNTLQQQRLADAGIFHTCVIPHGYNHHLIDKARALGRNKSEKFKLAVVSKRYARKVKGEAYLFELAKRLDPTTVSFLLVGDGRSEEAYIFRKYGFEVEAFERLPYPTLIDAYRSVDALIMTSYFEGGPANIPEAAAMGVPILSNPIGMVPDLVENGRHGIYLTMNPTIDAETISKMAVNEEGVYSELLESSTKPHPNLITWNESITRNMEQHIKLVKDSQVAINNALDSIA